MQVGGFEEFPDLRAAELGFAAVGPGLDNGAELDLHAPWHGDASVLLQQEGNAALAGLTVDTHDAVIGTSQVLRVYGQIGHAPWGIGFLRRKAFGNRILV